MQCDTESIAAIVAGIVLILNTLSTVYTNILAKRHEFRTDEIKAKVETIAEVVTENNP